MRQPRWRQRGTAPDYRFSLANERTFLAWLRTSLALLAGAVATVVVCAFAVLRVRHLRDGEGAPRALAIAGTSAAVCLLACCAVAVMLVR